MRIALATSSYAPYVGGVEEHVRQLARELAARGHEVAVWTVEREGGFRIETLDGIPVWSLPAPLPARGGAALLRFGARAPRAALAWRRALASFRPDVVHVHCFGPNGSYARALARLGRVPLVLTSHGETLADDHGLFTRAGLASRSLRGALREAVAVTGPSHATLRDLELRFGLPPGAGVVVPNGVDGDQPVGPAPDGARGRYIAAVGRLQTVKGFDLLIGAFAAAGLPSDVSLVIGGDGPEQAALDELAKRLGVGARVVFPGRLGREAVAGLLAGAAIGVVPSRFESFGIAALEVWRAGIPLVATTRGGPSEFVRDGVDGLLVDPEDTASLAGALSRLIADPALAHTFGAAGARRAGEYGWGAVAAAYEWIYTGAVAPGHTRAAPGLAATPQADRYGR